MVLRETAAAHSGRARQTGRFHSRASSSAARRRQLLDRRAPSLFGGRGNRVAELIDAGWAAHGVRRACLVAGQLLQLLLIITTPKGSLRGAAHRSAALLVRHGYSRVADRPD